MSPVSWRMGNVKYTANEIYVDVIETIDVVLDKNGGVISAIARGDVICNSRLSGMPDIIISFANPRVFCRQSPGDHGSRIVSLHQSVDIPRFERDGIANLFK
jgi:AP-3 complex subunit mu